MREQRSYNNSTGELVQRVEGLSLPDQNIALQEGFSSDEGEPRKPQDFLLFEYLERDPPFGRGPLADKVSNCLPWGSPGFFNNKFFYLSFSALMGSVCQYVERA